FRTDREKPTGAGGRAAGVSTQRDLYARIVARGVAALAVQDVLRASCRSTRGRSRRGRPSGGTTSETAALASTLTVPPGKPDGNIFPPPLSVRPPCGRGGETGAPRKANRVPRFLALPIGTGERQRSVLF